MSNTKKIAKTVTSAKQWKRNKQPLELPSGNVVEVKNPGIMALANKGLVPNSLMVVIQESIKKGKQPTPEEVMSESIDIAEMLEMVDKTVVECVTNPSVHPDPIANEDGVEIDPVTGEPADDDADWLYLRDFGDEDKMFIFQWVTGGVSNLEQFRSESSNLLAPVRGQQDVALPAK